MMIQKGTNIKGAKALLLGVTFKENCPDIRNSKVVDIYNELVQFGLEVDVFDPHAEADQVKKEYAIELQQTLSKYDAIILTVAHKEFLQMNLSNLKKGNHTIVFDSKAALDRESVDARL
jgi:UDP-N-acetyl-D-galactosamine dehydrogenase